MKHMMNEYNIIYNILLEVISGKNLNETFNNYIKNIDTNVSKIKDISYGVIRYYFVINCILETLTKNKPQLEIYVILLIAIYEIKYTKKAVYAITNELVGLSFKITKNSKIKNFVNAVIRNFIRTQAIIENRLNSNLEYKYNFPMWMINKIKEDYTLDWQNIVLHLSKKPKLSLRINPNKITTREYKEHLEKNHINYELINDVLIIDTLPINKIPFFKDGYVSIQDINAQKLNQIIKFNSKQYILDACSAPGGKACQILENNEIDLLALDIEQIRLNKIKENLDRLNLEATLICADASNLTWWDRKKFDVIIVDAPCSASGTIKRNPDIKLHRQISDIQNFVNTQKNIVFNLWQTLKDDGYMLYITCSIFKEENQDNINLFRTSLPNIKIIKELQLLPDEYGDGFYYCLLKKEISL